MTAPSTHEFTLQPENVERLASEAVLAKRVLVGHLPHPRHTPQRRDQPQRHIGADMRRARRTAISIDAQRRDAVARAKHDLPRHPRLPPRDGHGQAGRSEAKREDQGSETCQ